MIRKLFWLWIVSLFWISPSFGAINDCTLTWTARTEADLAGYRVLWGTVSGSYPNSQQLGRVTTTTCASLGITIANTYYFVVRPFDNAGNVAANSNQISLTLATIPDPPAGPTITSFAPTSGVVGSSVTISGTNFSSTLASNSVKFNGVSASFSSGNTTQLIVTVPASATTGKITVTVGAETATSSSDFTISTLPVSATYDSELDFSHVQGPIWYYLDQANVQMTYTAGLWSGAELYQYLWNTGGHPGNAGGTAKRRFVVPTTGLYSISGVSGDYDVGGGDGVTISVVYNDTTTLYTRVFANGAGDVAYALSQSMTAGDTLDFIIARNSEASYDSTHFTAQLAVSVSPPAPPPPPPSPTPPSPTPTTSLLSLAASASTIFVGESLVLTITLDRASSTTSAVTITNTDSNILATPSTVNIPAGSTSAGFTVLGVGVGQTTVRASFGTVTKPLSITINPLATVVAPLLLAPSDKVELPHTTKFVILRWQSIPSAVRYELRLRDDTVSSDNTSPCIGYRVCLTNLTNTSYRVELKRGHSYTWFVRWVDIAGNVSADSDREFSVHLNH